DGRRVRRLGAREERAGPGAPDLGGDEADLLGRLGAAQDGLGVPPPGLATEVEVRDVGDVPGFPVHGRTATSGRVNAPDWMPRRSSATKRKPAAPTAAWRASCISAARGMSAASS